MSEQIRIALNIKFGEIKEEKTYFKLNVGSNKPEADNLKAQIFNETGKEAQRETLWIYSKAEREVLDQELSILGLNENESYEYMNGRWYPIKIEDMNLPIPVLDVPFFNEPLEGNSFFQYSTISSVSYDDATNLRENEGIPGQLAWSEGTSIGLNVDASKDFIENVFQIADQMSLQINHLKPLCMKFKNLEVDANFDSWQEIPEKYQFFKESGSTKDLMLDPLIDGPTPIRRLLDQELRAIWILNDNLYVDLESYIPGASTYESK